MPTIVARARPEQLYAFLRLLPDILAGRVDDQRGIAEGFRSRVAWSFLSLVKENFEKLGRGERGADGTVWPPLSQKYLAYQRPTTGRGRPKAGGKWPGGHDGFMTDAQEQQWWKIYRQSLAWLLKMMDLKQAKARAAMIATKKYKEAGGKTKLESAQFGLRRVGVDYQIGVDRGIMRNSLTPGELSDTYSPEPNQVVREESFALLVGTNVPYALAFHRRRRLWPAELPQEWIEEIVFVTRSGLLRILTLVAQGLL